MFCVLACSSSETIQTSGEALAGCPPDATSFSWPVPPSTVSITSDASWKHNVNFPGDSFRSYSVGGTAGQGGFVYIKFSIFVSDPEVVYFQNSKTYPFHYDFAQAHLDPYLGISREDFDQVTLFESNQEVILGALVFPATSEYGGPPTEAAIQFVGQDEYHPEMVRQLHDTVLSHINVAADASLDLFYFPTYEQTECTNYHLTFLEDNGVDVDSFSRWVSANQCYSQGWGVGELKYFSAEEVESAYASGQLTSTDILLTDDIPAELPPLRGVVSTEPATPNSHVAILAQTFGIPFAYANQLGLQQDLTSMVGRRIGLEVNSGYSCSVRAVDLEDSLTSAQYQDLEHRLQPEPLNFPAKESDGTLVRPCNGLTRADAKFVGGKSSNFGYLLASIPSNVPQEARAYSFDLWDSFMSQDVSGTPMNQRIQNALSPHQTFPPSDIAALYDDLSDIRDMIKDGEFTPAMKTAIINSLSDLDPNQKIRFRSSTNLEDTESFTGAGLYDSYSGCLADDLDADDTGPSHCDPSKPNERGVFRAMRKVFASYYNDNAHLERLRLSVPMSQVGMAILAHYSFPDSDEVANGVITVDIGSSIALTVVSQPGAASVANPDENVSPELTKVHYYPGLDIIWSDVVQYSSLLPFGQAVLSDDEYEQLAILIKDVSDVYGADIGKTHFKLDLEYKKTSQGIIIKQVREIPQVDNAKTVVPYLAGVSSQKCPFQGEQSDVFAIHRSKNKYVMSADATHMGSLSSNPISYIEGYRTNSASSTFRGDPSRLNNSFFRNESDRFVFGFDVGGLIIQAQQERFSAQERAVPVLPPKVSYAIETIHPYNKRKDELPVVVLEELNQKLEVDYHLKLPFYDWNGIGERNADETKLGICPEDVDLNGALLQTRQFEADGITITTEFYWPPAPTGVTAGYTAPALKFVQTTIEGLTDAPITLTSQLSQSYRPGHHNFSEDFIFEPAKQPGLSSDIRLQLAAKNLTQLYFRAVDLYDGEVQSAWFVDRQRNLQPLSDLGKDDEPPVSYPLPEKL